ncbi:MAG: hypothetical protein QQW96_14905 [Tychonema bourrellyi B0820]|nr:hypothetical protein [Tychonema bourrellyi B0820]
MVSEVFDFKQKEEGRRKKEEGRRKTLLHTELDGEQPPALSEINFISIS